MRSRRIRISKEQLRGPSAQAPHRPPEPAAEGPWRPTRLQRPGLWALTGFNKGALQELPQGKEDRESESDGI